MSMILSKMMKNHKKNIAIILYFWPTYYENEKGRLSIGKNEHFQLFLIFRYSVSPGQKNGFKLAGNYLKQSCKKETHK